MPVSTPRGRAVLAVPIVALAAALGCSGERFSILGYQFGPDALYDTSIKTVYVPMFANRAFQTTPYRGIEAAITKAVVREIGRTTPYRVVSDCDKADTELKGVVVDISKQIVNRNQQNSTRQADLLVTVDVLWRDLHTGKILSATQRTVNPATGIPGLVLPPPVPFDPDVPQPPTAEPVPLALPTRLIGRGRIIEELGETNASAQKMAVDDLAVKVVSLMEKPWGGAPACPP